MDPLTLRCIRLPQHAQWGPPPPFRLGPTVTPGCTPIPRPGGLSETSTPQSHRNTHPRRDESGRPGAAAPGAPDWSAVRGGSPSRPRCSPGVSMAEPAPRRWRLERLGGPPGAPEPPTTGCPPCPPTPRCASWSDWPRCAGASKHDYRELKDGLGLDHFEGRSYLGWHRPRHPRQPGPGHPHPPALRPKAPAPA